MLKPNKGLLILLIVCSYFTGSGQANSVSPYSAVGVGNINPGSYARGWGLGGATIGLKDRTNLNISNPASYSNLALTTFDLGFFISVIEQEQLDPAINLSNGTGGLMYFSIGIPFSEKWGGAIGIRPYSLKGYNITSNRFGPDSIPIQDVFTGNGGLSQLYLGTSYTLFDGLSLGVNANFLFGRVDDIVSTVWNGAQNTPLDSRTENLVSVSGYNFDLGLQYIFDWNEKYEIGLGATLSNSSSLNAQYNKYSYTYETSTAGVENPIDTLAQDEGVESKIMLPINLGGGLSLGRKSDQLYNYAWALSMQYTYTEGSAFVNYNDARPLDNGYRISGGAYITPRFTFDRLKRSKNYLNIIEYRIGGFYEQSTLVVGGTPIPEYGMTFGLGLPFKTRSKAPGEEKYNVLNTGVVFSRRGTLDNGLIRESYINIFVGISLGDKWFIKYKYR